MTSYLRSVLNELVTERVRQIYECKYDRDHDDHHVNDEIAALACYYVMPPAARDWSMDQTGYGATLGDAILPVGWSVSGTNDRRTELIKAATLILAEIERIDRMENKL